MEALPLLLFFFGLITQRKLRQRSPGTAQQ